MPEQLGLLDAPPPPTAPWTETTVDGERMRYRMTPAEGKTEKGALELESLEMRDDGPEWTPVKYHRAKRWFLAGRNALNAEYRTACVQKGDGS